MALDFDELCLQHGEARHIPNDDLYAILMQIREDLANRTNMGEVGIDRIKQSRLGIEVRRRCKQDLLWLAGFFTWETNPEGVGKPITENRITEESHGVICREFFVQKNDALPLAEQSPIKNRMIMWPRNGQKTTLDIADTIQWILNFPDIRILFLSAGADFATAILDETKGHFVIKVGEPSLMNLFFPEFCKEEKDLGADGEYVCPVWEAKQVRRREPTILGAGIDTTLSGKHFDLIKGDDMVSNRNSENDDQCRKVAKNYNINKKMLMPYGYVDIIGTRYSDVDMYGDIIDKNATSMKGNALADTKTGQGWELTTNPDMSQIILVGRAIQIKPEIAEALEAAGKEVSYSEAGEEGCVLLLPQIQSYRFLCGDYKLDEIAFEGQRNQNPRPAVAVTFDKPLMQKNTIPWEDMPRPGKCRITQMWDAAISKKTGADSTTGSSVMWDPEGKMFVHDLIRKKFKPTELAKAIVDFAVKWRPETVGIEDAAGARFLEPQILSEAKRTKDPDIIALFDRLQWITPSNQKDAKKSRMGALHPWVVEGRMKIWNGLPHLETLYNEFEKCMVSHHHDDIPDVISYQPQLAPRVEDNSGSGLSDGRVPFDRNAYVLKAGWNILFEENCDAFGVPGAGEHLSIIEEFTEPMDEDLAAETPYGDGDPILGAGIFG